jgi:phage baseplate assembly protein W
MLKRQTYHLNPQDTGQPRGIGINILFNNGNSVFNQTFTTKDQVKSNLINYILTDKGERMFNPTFGGNLRKFIFEQITTGNLGLLKQDIQESLNLYFPNVIVEALNILPDTDNNQVDVTLKYSILDTGINDTIQIQFT